MADRTSFWTRTFAAARTDDDWYRVERFYTRATAAQIASDICCAHRRPPGGGRVRGVDAGEVWEARWEPAPDGPPADHIVWIRRVGVAADDTGSPGRTGGSDE
jgi:hypothetical protein